MRRLKHGEAAFNSLFAKYKHGAKKRNYAFTITKAEFKALTQRLCYYCGCPPCLIAKKAAGSVGDFVYNGADRADNTRGYELNNVVPCCKNCQFAKRTLTVQEFINWATRLVEHQNKLRL